MKELLDVIAEKVSSKSARRLLNKSIILMVVVNNIPINNI